MKSVKTLPGQTRRGSALVLSLIAIAMISTLAAAMATFSSANVQLAENLRRADTTRGSAESGLEVVRYWLSQVDMSGTIEPSQRFAQLTTTLQNELTSAGATNILNRLTCTGSTITVSDVPLLSSNGQSFSAVLTKVDNDTVQVDVTGQYNSLGRSIRSNFRFSERADTVFDFGVATKGPLNLNGNVELEGYNIDVESNAYIDCDDLLALSIIGNSMIAGEVSIRNSLANVYLSGHAGVGGDYGAAAMDHITRGVPPSDFPEMNPSSFFSYATGAYGHTLSAEDPTSGVSLTYENLHLMGCG